MSRQLQRLGKPLEVADVTIDFLKDVSAVLGVVLSAASVAALVSKRVRAALAQLIGHYSHTTETTASINELKSMFQQHLEEDKKFKEQAQEINDILISFVTTQCRDTIKNIFYKYNDEKVLPLYEKKTLMNISELYIGKLHKNSYASMLLKEMEKWEVDCSAQVGDE